MSFQSLLLSSITPSGPERAYCYRYYYAKSHKLPCAQSLPEVDVILHFFEQHNFSFRRAALSRKFKIWKYKQYL